MSGQPRERHTARGVPYVKTSVMVLGRDQIDAFRAMCLVAGRQPYQLAADLVLEAIRAQQADPALQKLMASLRRARSGLRVVQQAQTTTPLPSEGTLRDAEAPDGRTPP